MTKTTINLQDLRRKIYIKAKAEKTWRFWGLYVHVCKLEILRESYKLAKANQGAPGIDGVTFDMIETTGVDSFLKEIQEALQTKNYYPDRKRIKTIPKDNGNKFRVLSIPTIRDRVVEGALKLILEPIFEADFQAGCYGYRPKRTAAAAIETVTVAAIKAKTVPNPDCISQGTLSTESIAVTQHAAELIQKAPLTKNQRYGLLTLLYPSLDSRV